MSGVTLLLKAILIVWVIPVGQAFAQSETMVLIPAGEFQMGSNAAEDETPHAVHLSAFTIDKFEVTQDQFQKVMGNNPSDFNGKNFPVEQATWYEARDYCKALGKRLPTEAEWEKAARAGSHTVYTWGDAMDGDFAWHWDNSKRSTHPVGSRKPNRPCRTGLQERPWQWCDR